MSTFDARKTPYEAQHWAVNVIEALTQQVSTLAGDAQVEAYVAGSLRRANAEDTSTASVGDLDVIVTCREPEVVNGFGDLLLPLWLTATEKKAHGWMGAELLTVPAGAEIRPTGRMMVDAWWCPWESIGPFGLFLTGPPEMNIWLRRRAAEHGLMVTQYGLFEAVLSPTKMKPNRRVCGARLDHVDEGSSLIEAERLFWAQFVERCGIRDMPFPMPYEREEVMGRVSWNPAGVPPRA